MHSIPYMGKMAISLDVDARFMEVHDNPEKALCDGPTQWPLDKLEWNLLDDSEKPYTKEHPYNNSPEDNALNTKYFNPASEDLI